MAATGVDYLTTRELAELLRIKERKVYELAASGEVPCSRATGKLLFPRQAIEAWLASKSSGPETGVQVSGHRSAVFLGSHDPLLEWALRESRCGLASYFDGSLDGLARFQRGEGVATGMHLLDPASGDWNLAQVRARCADAPVVLVEFAWRQRGLVVAPGNPCGIRGLPDLRDRRLVPRQAEAGSQALLEHLLAAAGVGAAELELTATARTETDAALAVLEGKGDATLGLMSVARLFRLDFVPVLQERFDLLVERRSWFEPPLQALFGFCRSPTFAAKAAEMPGYDLTGLGRVHFNGAAG